MSADTTPTSPAAQPLERVYVKIPKAGPGQGYHAPKNFQKPLLDLLSRLAIIAICLSIPLVPGVIIGMIVATTYQTEPGLLWLWGAMTILIEAIAIFVAIGVAREALGVSSPRDHLPAAR